MTFSIIVVCRNAGEKLQKTIESIRSQTEDDYEIIVQDGFSTDGSVERLAVADAGETLRIFREKDTGIYDAMNRAVVHARGRYPDTHAVVTTHNHHIAHTGDTENLRLQVDTDIVGKKVLVIAVIRAI